jgi:hypothetical protein
MKRAIPAADPGAYVAALSGWQREVAGALRALVLKAAAVEETVKWGHLVYFATGPVLMIRAEGTRVVFGFWRGRRLGHIEPALKPGGKYEMATQEYREGSKIRAAAVRRLVREAVALNEELGDPRDAAPRRRQGR